MSNNEDHYMLNYEIRWKNFRCFKDTGWIELHPITVLLGPNNSGKTSLLSPLLLMKQTWLSSDPLTPLVTKGEITDLGTYRQLINSHDESKDLFFGFRYHTHEPDDELEPVPAYPPGALELIFSSDDSEFGFHLNQYKIYDLFKRPLLTRKLLKSGRYSIQGKLFANMASSERKALLDVKPFNFLFTSQTAIDNLVKEIRGPDSNLPEKFSDPFTLYLSTVSSSTREMDKILRNLSYIGPLREAPRRYYERANEIHRSVGIRGHQAPDLFYRRYNEISEQLNEWIRKFDLGHSIYPNEISPNLFEIVLNPEHSDIKSNLADSGFGASQLFPLLIQALVATKGTLTIAEQPEIHLNPKLQTLLADLFVEMAKTSHRVIIETHSEHLLLRLRVLLARGTVSSEDVAVYFVSMENGISKLRRVPIESNGHIEQEDWPTGFFGDTLTQSLALAEAQFQKRQ